MSGSTVKQKVLEAMEKLPVDATLEDAIERLVLMARIERGLAELDAGHGVVGKASAPPVTRIIWAPHAIEDRA